MNLTAVWKWQKVVFNCAFEWFCAPNCTKKHLCNSRTSEFSWGGGHAPGPPNLARSSKSWIRSASCHALMLTCLRDYWTPAFPYHEDKKLTRMCIFHCNQIFLADSKNKTINFYAIQRHLWIVICESWSILICWFLYFGVRWFSLAFYLTAVQHAIIRFNS